MFLFSMQNNPLVTVICSCFNHADYVLESLQSVLNQSYKNIQIVVIDDVSSDNSVKIIQDFITPHPEIIFIKNSENLGLNVSVSNAMQFVKGDYFIDLAADDVLLPNCITTQVNTFKNSKFKNLAIVYGNAELIDENNNHLEYYFKTNKNLKSQENLNSGNIYQEIISEKTVICTVAGMYNKLVFDNLSGYDQSLAYEDFDYWIRASRNHNIEFIDAVLVKKRILKSSMHNSFRDFHDKYGQSTFKILEKAYHLNRSKSEHKTLKKRVLREFKTSVKKINFSLIYKNALLYLKLNFKSI